MNLVAVLILAQTVAASETITVTATRSETRLSDTPASVVVISDETLARTAAPTLDDALRQVAGFTLFRRSGSRTANPTAQGVTLRGIGASGASRALVLDDGIPLNDPFGGWVYWGRVPRTAVDRAEILRGGASDLYGSSAMGGVVQFVRKRSGGPASEVSVGSHETGVASLFAAGERGAWSGSVAAELLTTGGFVAVRESDRGAVDVEAGSRHATLDLTARRKNAFVRLSHYREERDNGTPLQVNDTANWQLAGGLDRALFSGVASLRGYVSTQDYVQTFSAVAPNRASERLTVEQEVPSRGAGLTVQFTRALGGRHVLISGVDARLAEGTSEERRFTPSGTFDVAAGGEQSTAGVFVEDLVTITPALSLTAGVRGDFWRNEGDDTRREDSALSPRLALLWRASDALALSASAYQSFRAPTLNELYRGFRVGNVVTLPNAGLAAEELTGFEAGARARNVRLTLFVMDVTNAIANVTIANDAGTITRQRRNLGASRSVGAELDGEWRFGRDVRASAGLMFVDAEVREGELRGKRVPQVPRHQASAQLSWRTFGAQLRWSGMQYDDDLNELALASYVVTDVFAAIPIGAGIDATIAVENLFDEDVEVSATPVVSLGQPRAWRVGLRYQR